MIPPTTTGTSTPALAQRLDDARDQLAVRAATGSTGRRRGRPPAARARRSATASGGCPRRRRPCPTSRARTAICSAPLEWPSRPGLPTRIFSRRPERLGDALDLLAQRRRGRRPPAPAGGLADAGRRAVRAEDVAQRLRPLAGRHARAGGGDRRGHDVLVVVGGDARAARRAPRRPRPGRAARATRSTRLALLGLDARVDGEDAAVGAVGQRRRLGLGVPVEADDDLLAAPRCGGCARGASRRARPSCTATASTAPPCSATTAISARAPSTQLGDEARP